MFQRGARGPRKGRHSIMEADVVMIPQTWGELTDKEDIKGLNRILDHLNDDVQAVYYNWDE